MPPNGFLEGLHKALAESELQAINDNKALLNSILPDNTEFSADDATDWERRLGIITNSATDLEDRKMAILRKMSFPGNIPARQHYLWLERQLRAAGFDVYVYENRFDYGNGSYYTMLPEDVYDTEDILDFIDHGELDHGDFDHGAGYNNIIANSITQEGDRRFSPGNNLRSTFFIGGDPIGSFASIPASREKEFRQLILFTKPTQTVGFLFIDYV
jgi:hypothetical protein